MDTATQKIQTLYRAVVADGGTEKTQIRAAIREVAAQIEPLIESGEIVPDVYAWVRSVVMQIDKSDGARADDVLAAIARGEDDLSDDVAAPLLDLVVTLGRGGRKVYRFLTADDLEEMNELRHTNVRSVNRAYHKNWRPRYEAWRIVLRRNLTIGAAVEAGDLPREATLFEAS